MVITMATYRGARRELLICCRRYRSYANREPARRDHFVGWLRIKHSASWCSYGLQSAASRPSRTQREGGRAMASIDQAMASATRILRRAISEFAPTHIVSMVSGGRDSAASHAVAEELGGRIDLVLHGNTRCGISETTRWVEQRYGGAGPDFAVADAGTAYEDYVLRKGFFGKGIGAHGFAYRVLKAQPFRKAISKHIRRGRRGVRILLLNGARRDESENRRKNLALFRRDPAAPNNIWANLIHDWSSEGRDEYLASRAVPINPVAQQLCRSGECMCGTMQSAGERLEAAALYPNWGRWLADLETEVRRLHGFGWGEPFPRRKAHGQGDPFQPMCQGCVNRKAA